MATTNTGKKAAPAKSAPRKTGTGTAAKKSGTAARKPKTPPAPAKDPIRNRGVKAFLLIALAIFSAIGCFTGEGIFIGAFREFMMGLVGKGFYFLPIILLYCGLMLLYVRDRPLGGRITCALLLTVMAGALGHLFGCMTEFPWDWKLTGSLYDAGSLAGEAGSGGVIGGLLALCFQSLFNRVGAAIVLLLGTLFLLFAALNVTVAAIIERSREAAKVKAEEWKLMRQEEQRRSEERRAAAEEARKKAQEEAARRAAEEEKRRREEEEEARKQARIDIPMPSHPVTAAPEKPAKRRSTIDIPLDDGPVFEKEPAPAREERKRDPDPAPAPPKPAAGKSEKPAAGKGNPDRIGVSEKDWLAEILTRERDRGKAAASAADKVVQTAIRPGSRTPAPAKMEPKKDVPAVGIGEVKADQAPQAPLPAPEDSELFKAPKSVPKPPQPKSVTPEEAAAVLAGEKAAKAVEKAETVKARDEMVASIEENLADQAQAQPVKYVFPPITLLTAGSGDGSDEGYEEMQLNAKRLNATIKSFGIPAELCDVTRGPTVTRYEVELEQGVKLNRLTNLSDDIALALGVSGVRIAPVPDKIAIVGIEVPNKKTTTVYLRDIIDTSTFREKSSSLTFAIGKDIGGTPIVGDIAKLPHLLIAGTTGSGKSVCMNCLILSLLYKSSPEDVRLIMVDPKMIELGVYNGIPHLLIPVVTDPKKAAGALQWSVMEMMKRYTLMRDSGARDLASYNKLMEKTEGGQKLPKIAILIDELADLMMTAAKEVEESICRIAQMGRAAGIHLVIATQRPSADVITGLMKANISSRIAFAVDSALNSRIILDTSGAEKLVGKGDMLYAPIGAGKPTRIQGAFVTDEEREEVINFVKEQGLAVYSKDIQDEIERSADKDAKKAADEDEDEEDSGDLDELFNEAVEVVLDSKQASVSMLQRRLKLGYSRAARIVDQMEEQGVVGPFEGSKPRAVLMTREQWAARTGGVLPTLPEDDEGVPEEID